jgi:hypothetical protein
VHRKEKACGPFLNTSVETHLIILEMVCDF